MNTPLLARRKSSRKISLTPLIDVVFILLLFFMLSSSFHDWRFIDWPAANAEQSETNSDKVKPRFLLLHKSGRLTLWPDQRSWSNATDLNSQELKASLIKKNAALLLVPEADTQLQTMVTAVEHLKSLGVSAQLTEPVDQHAVSG